MSIGSSKSKIFDKIKLYSSIANSDIDNKSFSSLLSTSNNPYEFLFDIIKTTSGEGGLETLTQVVLSKVITQSFLNKLSDKIYNIIGKAAPENLTINNTTFDVSVKSIDPTNSFKNPNTVQNSIPFNQTIFNQVLSNPNNSISFNLIQNEAYTKQLKMTYDEVTKNIKTEIPQITSNDLIIGLKSLIGPMFNANVIINEIINILFHTDFKKEDAQILTMIRSYTNYESKNGFKMDLKKLLDLELNTSVEGYNIDVNCFRENITVTKEQIDKLIQEPTVQNFRVLIPEFLDETSQNVKNDYYKNIIKAIIEAILSIIIKQPVIVFFISLWYKIVDFFADLNEFEFDIPGLFEKFKDWLEQIFDDIYREIFCVIFNWIKKQLIKLVVSVTIILLKEQLEKRKGILESLTGSRFTQRSREFNI
jgi:hypothetical protein